MYPSKCLHYARSTPNAGGLGSRPWSPGEWGYDVTLLRRPPPPWAGHPLPSVPSRVQRSLMPHSRWWGDDGWAGRLRLTMSRSPAPAPGAAPTAWTALLTSPRPQQCHTPSPTCICVMSAPACAPKGCGTLCCLAPSPLLPGGTTSKHPSRRHEVPPPVAVQPLGPQAHLQMVQVKCWWSSLVPRLICHFWGREGRSGQPRTCRLPERFTSTSFPGPPGWSQPQGWGDSA